MSAPVEDVSVRMTRDVHVRLGTPMAPLRPSYKKGEFRPTDVRLQWQHDGGQWSLTAANVSGPMLKKDGSDSQNRGDRRFYDWRGRLSDDAPAWVREFVSRYAPEPQP